MIEGFGIRLADFSRPGELHWIMKRWILCDRKTAAAQREGRTYLELERKRIQRCLRQDGALVLVAHCADDEDALAAFLVAKGDILHYLYVRRMAQGLGLARELCSCLPAKVRTSHMPVNTTKPLPSGWSYEGYPCVYVTS